MEKSTLIREFESSDMDIVLDIWLRASIKSHNFVEKGFWQSQLEVMRSKYIPASETFVFTDNGVIKGFFSIRDDILAAVFVAPEAQGRGIGTQLLNKAKSFGKDLSLTVYKKNTKSVDFYKKNGFVVKKENICSHTGEIELLMQYRQK